MEATTRWREPEGLDPRVRPQVYLHAGMGKVASTWLQYRVFPKLRGVRYIQRNKFQQSVRIIERGGAEPFLVSRELGFRHASQAVTWFSAAVPQARPILILRRHDSWLASVYRRAVKNGRFVPFDEFLDLDHDRGVRPQSSALFRARIQLLEDGFHHKPLVLFYHDLQTDAGRFVRVLADYVGATYESAEISLDPIHRSYGQKQLRVMRALGRRRPAPSAHRSQHPFMRWCRVRSRLLGAHVALEAARLVPEALLSDEPLVRPEQLERVREFYAEDWQACLTYARANNPPLP